MQLIIIEVILLSTMIDKKRLTANFFICLIIVCFAFLSLYLRLPYLKTPLLIVDEAFYSEVANRFIDGDINYTNNKPPGIFFLYAFMFRLFGKNNIHSLQVLAGISVILSGLIVFFILKRLKGNIAGVIGAVVYMVLPALSKSPSNFYAANTEVFMMFFLTASILFFAYANNRGIFLFLSGVCCAFGFMMKQPGALLLPTIIVANTLNIWHKKHYKRVLIDSAMLFLGFLAVLVPIFIYFASKGAFSGLIYNLFTVNRMYFEPKPIFEGIKLGVYITFNTYMRYNYLIYLPALAQAAFYFFMVFYKRDGENKNFNIPLFFVLWFCVSIYCVSIGWRFSGHYYYMLFPVLSCLFAILWDVAIKFFYKHYTRKKRFIGLLLLMISYFSVAFSLWYPLSFYNGFIPNSKSWVTYLDFKGAMGENIKMVSYYITARSKPDDRLFVWGYCPEIYVLSNRRCATRFVHCDYLVGDVDPYLLAGTPDRIKPDHWDLFISEITRNKPVYIIDISPSNYLGFGMNPIDKYPKLQAVIEKYYSLDKRIGKTDLYILNQ